MNRIGVINSTATYQSGNALFLILIGIVLFGALSYAVTQSTRGFSNIDRERKMMAKAVSEQCSASVNFAVKNVKLFNGCQSNEISFELPDGDNPNPNAPTDKRCHIFHPNGGGVAPCGAWLGVENCDLEALELGESCPNGDVIYAGNYNGRLYTTAGNSGSVAWASVVPSSGSGAGSTTNGMANTNVLLAIDGIDFPAAELCRSLGPEWYLPARYEIGPLYTNRHIIGGFDPVRYWTSTNHTDNNAWHRFFGEGTDSSNTSNKTASVSVRCVRR